MGLSANAVWCLILLGFPNQATEVVCSVFNMLFYSPAIQRLAAHQFCCFKLSDDGTQDMCPISIYKCFSLCVILYVWDCFSLHRSHQVTFDLVAMVTHLTYFWLSAEAKNQSDPSVVWDQSFRDNQWINGSMQSNTPISQHPCKTQIYEIMRNVLDSLNSMFSVKVLCSPRRQ